MLRADRNRIRYKFCLVSPRGAARWDDWLAERCIDYMFRFGYKRWFVISKPRNIGFAAKERRLENFRKNGLICGKGNMRFRPFKKKKNVKRNWLTGFTTSFRKVFILHTAEFLAGRVVILECFSSTTNIFFWIAVPPRLPLSWESLAGNEAWQILPYYLPKAQGRRIPAEIFTRKPRSLE